jgi:hypothetical protein
MDPHRPSGQEHLFDPQAGQVREQDTENLRSHDEHDHKREEPGTTGHAAASPITESVPEPVFNCRRHV